MNPAVMSTNANGSMTGTSTTGMQDSGSSANVINERLNAELKEQQEKVFAERGTTELRAQLEANLQRLFVVIAATNVAKTSQYPCSTSRYSDSETCTQQPRLHQKNSPNLGPREIQCHFGQSLSSNHSEHTQILRILVHLHLWTKRTIKNALESMEEELLEVNSCWKSGNHARRLKPGDAADSYVGLLTDGIGME